MYPFDLNPKVAINASIKSHHQTPQRTYIKVHKTPWTVIHRSPLQLLRLLPTRKTITKVNIAL